MKRYNPKEIEPKWQKIWDETNVYTANLKSDKPKYIGMSMFNYPSGAGIHIGHAMNYTISDVKARFKRQQGYESYHPVGWDAFGLPAENYAIKAGVSPQESMATIIPGYHKQYKAMGWSNDWEKEIATHTPEYYKWTQWIFSQMFKHGLAYQDARMQWWCTKCQTVLANEQVIDGKCWRHDGPDDPIVEKKEVKQWFFKITEYADELLEAIDGLDWTESVKLAQKNWIGKSVGAEISFAIANGSESRSKNQEVRVFTTRPDTLFGVTFMVIAPESELLQEIITEEQRVAVDKYVKESAKKTEIERQASKEKTGVFTGAYVINPANQEKIPVWVADYVLAGYGTGAIMAVPAHDERDFEFAEEFNLPIRQVVTEEFIDTLTPPREDIKTAQRRAVQCIIKNPENNTYLILKKLKWETETYSLVNGGIEEGESVDDAARRETLEEAGFKNIASIEHIGQSYFAEFYHEMKKENVRAQMYTVVVDLTDLEKVEVTEEEAQINELSWVSKAELCEKVHGEGLKKQLENYFNSSSLLTSEGRMINSGSYDGLLSSEVREKIVSDLSQKGTAEEKVNFRMRDWSVSRQRYWGAPIPIVNCEKCGTVLVPDEQLPVVLPELTDFQPSGDGRSALARATDWLSTECPECSGPAERETDTLDTYICSSWYMFRYLDPHNQEKIFESDVVNKWMPIDFYNGGDHATAHMLYARFVTRFFSKIGLVDNPEPFKQFLFNGKVRASDGSAFSKSKGNGIDPLEVIESGYGADALRMYLMFAAPLEINARWDPQGVPGTFRFLTRLWNLVQEYLELDQTEDRGSEAEDRRSGTGDRGSNIEHHLRMVTHKMIKKVTEDIQENRYNTAIAGAMAGLNDLYALKNDSFAQSEEWQAALEAIVAVVAPFAPHIADELWNQLGYSSSVHTDSWPEWKEEYLQSDTLKVVVQVNGKVRATIEVDAGASEEEVVNAAKANEKVGSYLTAEVKKTIYVPKKLVNFVV